MKSDFEWTVVQAGDFWPSNDGIPAGEEWEVYVSIPSGAHSLVLRKDEKTMILSKEEVGGPFQSFPARQVYGVVSGGTDVYAESLSPHGWRLTKEERITCDVIMIVRARRIR